MRESLQRPLIYISHADVLIIGGTSLVVYPAAGMVDYFRGRTSGGDQQIRDATGMPMQNW